MHWIGNVILIVVTLSVLVSLIIAIISVNKTVSEHEATITCLTKDACLAYEDDDPPKKA